MKAILLDGNQRSALAVTRSLGSRGIAIHVGSEVEKSIASSSKYCTEAFYYPNPYNNPSGFVESVRRNTEGKSGILFPMTDVTLCEILSKRHLLNKNIVLPFVDYDKYISASDKSSLVLLSNRLGIPVPRTLFLSDYGNPSSLLKDAERMAYPLVVKTAFSRVRTSDGWVSGGVKYARNSRELSKILEDWKSRGINILVQEKIEGHGFGIFLLMHDGEVISRFAHRRIREKPPSGGVSVLCESITPPHGTFEYASKLLRELNWTGIAMVEFKWDDKENKAQLMEINARFWGSLQLAISSGVDFPYHLFQMAEGKKVNAPKEYKTGVKSRWELGDLDHLLIRMKKSNSALMLPKGAPSRFTALKNFAADFFDPTVKNEVFRFSDSGPFFREIKRYLADFVA